MLPERFTFVGGHPLGGAPRGGIEYARPDLFVDRPWLFTPEDDSTTVALERLYRFVRKLGAEPQRLDPAEHDRLLALVSHLIVENDKVRGRRTLLPVALAGESLPGLFVRELVPLHHASHRRGLLAGEKPHLVAPLAVARLY